MQQPTLNLMEHELYTLAVQLLHDFNLKESKLLYRFITKPVA